MCYEVQRSERSTIVRGNAVKSQKIDLPKKSTKKPKSERRGASVEA